MNPKNYRAFYLLLVKVFIVISVVGIAMLIYTGVHNGLSTIAFSLIAFVISVAALVMTTLQSLSIARQVRITQHSARLVTDASHKIEGLVREDRKMERELRQDLQLDHAIIAVLEDYGVGEDEVERKHVAALIARAVKSDGR